MSVLVFALLEGILLLIGGLTAARLVSRIARQVDRDVVLMASVAVWFILFAMVPFLVFALFVDRVVLPSGGIDALPSLLLNAIPFALVAAPVIGFAQGWKSSKSKPTA